MSNDRARRERRSLSPAIWRALMEGGPSKSVIVGLVTSLLAVGVAAGLIGALLAAGGWNHGLRVHPVGPTRAMAGAISWPDGQELPTFATPAAPLAYIDLTGASNDDKALFASLQGLVNRARPRIYIGDGAAEGNTTWADSLHLAYTPMAAATALRRYARVAAGLVVWDPSQPDTLNLATTIAGLRGGLVVSPAQAPLLQAAPYHLPILQDLRGRFSSRLEIYRYAFANLWGQTTHKILVGLNPSVQYDDLRDEAVANGLMVIYLDPSNPTEAALYDQFVAGMPLNGAYLGWFPNDVTGEVAGTTTNSRSGVMTFAADYFLNMTVLSGTHRAIHMPAPPPPPPLGHKIYVAFNLSDGDNLQENEHRMRQIWDDPARGTVPLSWTISPALVDAAPGLLDWYGRTATRGDELVAGVSGLGYIRPDEWPCDAYSRFTQRGRAYLATAGLTVIHLLDASNTVPACAVRAYARGYPVAVGPVAVGGRRASANAAGRPHGGAALREHVRPRVQRGSPDQRRAERRRRLGWAQPAVPGRARLRLDHDAARLPRGAADTRRTESQLRVCAGRSTHGVDPTGQRPAGAQRQVTAFLFDYSVWTTSWGRSRALDLARLALIARGAGGLYWIVPGVVCSFLDAFYLAWVLLIEINR